VRRGLAGAVALALLALAGYAVVIAVAAGLPAVEDLGRRAPHRTAMMRARIEQARRAGRSYRIRHTWVPYARISPLLRRAVLVAEDDAFFSHGGLDWNEIRESAQRNLERRSIVRGGSTITQQLAKNLYLGNRRTVTRKLQEVLLAMRMERTLGKRRIFELYLNLIEWGEGVFGAEAAARHHFGVSAAALTPRQAALLAAVIINPRRYSASAPDRRIERRANRILARLYRRGHLTEDQYLAATGRAPRAAPDTSSAAEWLFGAPPSPPPSQQQPPEVSDSTAAPDTMPVPEGTS
jgi:monofunctional glycosyltransferase